MDHLLRSKWTVLCRRSRSAVEAAEVTGEAAEATEAAAVRAGVSSSSESQLQFSDSSGRISIVYCCCWKRRWEEVVGGGRRREEA